MAAKKTPVTTPLHLLQQLSNSLVAHLQKACDDAQKDAQILLAKLEKQRGKTQEKLIKARAKLDEAGNAGKSKAQAKARSRLAELDDMLAVLQSRQSETLSYLAELKRDAEQSLNLAQGVSQVEKAAAQALASREKPAPSRAAAARGKAPVGALKPAKAGSAKKADSRANAGSATTNSRAAASRAKPSAAKSSAAAKQGEAKTSPTKTVATRAPSTSRRPASTNGKAAPAAQPASTATKPAAAKKPAARKPATTRSEAVAQSGPTAS